MPVAGVKNRDKVMKEQEHYIQVACVNWFRYQYPQHLIWAVPNGGQRNAVVAAKLKAEGVLAGVPDLFVAVVRGSYSGLFVEMKAGKNKPTDEQKSVIQQLWEAGYKCEVCWSVEEFKSIIDSYLR